MPKHSLGESQRAAAAQELSQILLHSPTIFPTKAIEMTSSVSNSLYLGIDVGTGSARAGFVPHSYAFVSLGISMFVFNQHHHSTGCKLINVGMKIFLGHLISARKLLESILIGQLWLPSPSKSISCEFGLPYYGMLQTKLVVDFLSWFDSKECG
jgi:hypothetical protein